MKVKLFFASMLLLPSLVFGLITPDRIITGGITLDTAIGEPSPSVQGDFWWDADEETMSLRQNGAVLQVGQELQYHVKNQTGVEIADCVPVMAVGSLGASGRILVDLMDGTDPVNAKYFLGVTTEVIPDGEDGKVTFFGKVRGCELDPAFDDGSVLWISSTTAGEFTVTEPTPPALALAVAFVIDEAPSGTIAVRATQHNESDAFGDVDGGNYSMVESDGTIISVGDATTWTDLKIPLTASKVGALAKPDFDFTNVAYLFPQNDASEVLYFIAQMPHEWKEGTTIYPHIHWQQSAATAVTWKLDYKVYKPNSAVPAAFTTISGATGEFTWSSGNLHQISRIGTGIDMTGLTLSTIILGKLYRDDNTTTGDVPAWDIDFHYQMDTMGSRQEYIK